MGTRTTTRAPRTGLGAIVLLQNLRPGAALVLHVRSFAGLEACATLLAVQASCLPSLSNAPARDLSYPAPDHRVKLLGVAVAKVDQLEKCERAAGPLGLGKIRMRTHSLRWNRPNPSGASTRLRYVDGLGKLRTRMLPRRSTACR